MKTRHIAHGVFGRCENGGALAAISWCCGILSVCVGLLIGTIILLNSEARSHGGHNLLLLLPLCILLTVLGVGQMCRLMAALVLFSLLTALSGLWLIAGSIVNVPLPWLLVNVLMGVILCLPLVSLIYWGCRHGRRSQP